MKCLLVRLKSTVTTDEDLKKICDSNLIRVELKTALFSMKKGKPPVNGPSVEFYTNFWDIIQEPLVCMYCECVGQGEMITTMKKGITSLIQKPNKNNLLIENWRPMTLLTIDYKILASVCATGQLWL